MNHKVGYLLAEVKRGVIVHQVNAQGVMGGGIALAIRTKWPQVWEEYYKAIRPDQPDKGFGYMGSVIYVQVEPELWVANIVGQQFYGREPGKQYTSYEALRMGLASVSHFAENYGLDAHYPTIGCGLGGGDWTIVSKLIDDAFEGIISHTLWQMPE